MFRKSFVAALTLALLCVGYASARPQYKKAIEGLAPETEVEKDFQAKLKQDGCRACHEGGNAEGGGKPRNLFGKKLGDLLPKFDAKKWQGDALPDSVKNLRDALNRVK